MTSVTIEGDVVTGERIIEGINLKDDVPCELPTFHQIKGTPIAKAEWRIYWIMKAWCLCGCPEKTTLLCTECKESVLDAVWIQCTRCGAAMTTGSVIERIEPL